MKGCCVCEKGALRKEKILKWGVLRRCEWAGCVEWEGMWQGVLSGKVCGRVF